LKIFKTKNQSMKTNRREFIKAVSRNLLLGGMAGLSGYLVFRENRGGDAYCNFDFACKNCSRLQKCKLPEAANFRTNENQNNQP